MRTTLRRDQGSGPGPFRRSARALAVGDSVWDIQAARAAGIGCVAVETAVGRHDLGEAGALYVYRDVRELLDQFLTSPLAALLREGDRQVQGAPTGSPAMASARVAAVSS